MVETGLRTAPLRVTLRSMISPLDQNRLHLTRRHLFGKAATGIGTGALASLLGESALGAPPNLPASTAHGGLPGLPHHAPKAKNIIYLFQNGAPTHVDIFDYKPKLAELHGKPIPDSYTEGKRFSTMTGNAKGKLVLGPLEPFHQHGQSGAWVSELMPHVAGIADKLCFVRGMHTEAVNHAPAITYLLTGAELPGRPSMGAWLAYGLGSESEELPRYVVMTSISKGTTCGQIFYEFYWSSGFLPSKHQGVGSGAAPNPSSIRRTRRA